MRFIKKVKDNPKYEAGQERTISFFAWFPYTIGNETRWLETVIVKQKYESYYVDISNKYERYCVGLPIPKQWKLGWCDVSFVDLNLNNVNWSHK